MVYCYTTHMEKSKEFGPKLPTKEDVVNVAEGEGADEKEIEATVNLWLVGKEADADKTPGSLLRIRLNLELAELFLKINCIENARASSELAREMISNEMPHDGELLFAEYEELYRLSGDLHYEIKDEEDRLGK